MSTVAGFLKLDNRYSITGHMKLDAAMHIGSGVVSAETDAPFFRDHKGPLIPGSSLRGVLRSRLERILQAVGGERGCVLFAADTHETCFTAKPKLLEEFNKRHADKSAADRERLLEHELLRDGGLCDICRLFGSTLLASKLRISDARPERDTMRIRDSVGIDRDTETAKEHIKYDFQTLDSEGFVFRADIENANDKDLALLAILFREMEEPGIDIGGKKGRGLGRCRLEKGSLKVTGFSGKDGLKRFLSSGQLAPVSDFETRLKDSLNHYLGGN